MSDLTSGRAEPKKETNGGLRRVYLYKHVNYPIQLLKGLKSGILSSHPTTLIFEYEGRREGVAERLNRTAYDIEARMVFPKIDLETNNALYSLIRNRVGMIAEDRNGRPRVYGIENGLEVEIRSVTGNAREDLNGYEVSFIGQEKYAAPFIGDLPPAGFLTEGLAFSCLLSSSGRPSSIADIVSSCSVLQQDIALDCLLSSSGLRSSIGNLVSDCNVAQSN